MQLDSGTQHLARWLLLVAWLGQGPSERVYRPVDLLDADIGDGRSGESCIVARTLNQNREAVLHLGIPLDILATRDELTRDELTVSWQAGSRIVEGRSDGIIVWRFDPAYGWRDELVQILWVGLAGNGEQAAVMGDKNTLQLWNISSDARKWRACQNLSVWETDELFYFCVPAWSPTGWQFAYCADSDSEMQLWSRNSSGCWRSYQALEAQTLSWSTDEQQLATSAGKVVALWDLGKDGQFEKKQAWPVASDCECVSNLKHTNPRSFQWHPLSQSLAVSADDGIHIWQVFAPGGPGGSGAWHLMHVLSTRDFASPASSMTWSHDGQHLVSGADTAPLHVWSIFGPGGWQKSRSFERTTNAGPAFPRSRWTLSANGFAFLATRLLLREGVLEHWSPSEEVAESPKLNGERIRNYGVSSTGLQLLILTKKCTEHWVASSGRGSGERWQLNAKRAVGSHCQASKPSIRWSPDDRRVAVACGYSIRIYEPTDNGSLKHTFNLSAAAVRDNKTKKEINYIEALAWSPNSDSIVFGRAGTIHTWRPGDRHAVRHEGNNNHTTPIRSLQWSPNGQLIASASLEQIVVWKQNVAHEKFQQLVRFATNARLCPKSAWQWDLGPRLAWSIDSGYLATAECDSQLRFRDESLSFQVGYTLPVQGQVQDMVWSDGSLHVLSSSQDADFDLLQTWSLPVGGRGFLLAALGYHFPTADPSDWMASFCSSTHVRCSCKEGRCDVSLVLSAAQIEWSALQCGAGSRRIGAEVVFIRELVVRDWSIASAVPGLPDSAASLCERLSSFKHLRSLVLQGLTARGFWMCPLSAPMLRQLTIADAKRMQIPAVGLIDLFNSAPNLEVLNFTETAVPYLDGRLPRTLRKAVLRKSGVQDVMFRNYSKELAMHAATTGLLTAASQSFGFAEVCTACPQGRFNAEFSVSHLFECTPCQANEITLETASLSSANDCICDAGFLMMPGEGCRACIEIEQGENFNCSAPGLKFETAPVKDSKTVTKHAVSRVKCMMRIKQDSDSACLIATYIAWLGFMVEIGFLEGIQCATSQLKRATVSFASRSGATAVALFLLAATSAAALSLCCRQHASYWPTLARQNLVKPPSLWNALQPYVLREVLAGIQVYQLFGVFSKILPDPDARSEASVLETLQLNLGPLLLDSFHLDCIFSYTSSRMTQLIGGALLPLAILLMLYALLAMLPFEGPRRRKLWAQTEVQVINLLMVATASSVLAVGECDSEISPPIMTFVPGVYCNVGTYYLAVLFAVCLGGFYITYVCMLLLGSISRFNEIAKPVYKAGYAEYAITEAKTALQIKLPEDLQVSGYLQSAILDAHQVFCQQAIRKAHPHLDVRLQADLPDVKAHGTRLVTIDGSLDIKTQDQLSDILFDGAWVNARLPSNFQSLVVRCLFLQFDRDDREGHLRGLEVFTKFAPDSFHFELLLKLGFLLVAFIPQLEGYQAQGAVGGFVCSILCLALLAQPFSRPSQGRTLFLGLASLALAFLLLMISGTHFNLKADHHLCTLLNIARVFQLVPLMRMLLPLSCILIPETRRRNEDVSQELAFLQVSWQHVAYFKRQPYRVLQEAQLQEVGETGNLDGPKLPKLNEGTVVLPLCCREKLWEVEVKQAQKIWRGCLLAHLLEPIAVPLVSLRDAVACWSMELEDETTQRITVQFKAAISLAAIELLPPAAVTEKAMHLAAVVSSKDATTDVLRDDASEEPLATDGAESSCCRSLLQYHLHQSVLACALTLRGAVGAGAPIIVET
ncbi:Ciao1, partial [Symbiodinium sp. CCMP2456]